MTTYLLYPQDDNTNMMISDVLKRRSSNCTKINSHDQF